ncbi:MAG: hypothetical protein P1P82_02860 [Bacteroidales bacterium]|nr:hypothetical protein [Bacteroidales bacterium]MDT8430188.1 hypothetical protein [Bacteroidales bacterium]
MQPSKKILLLPLALLLVHACDRSRLNLDIAIVPREVMNFADVNSSRDDYNSAGPTVYFAGDGFTLVFSTNRDSNGADFDLVSYQCVVNFDQMNISFDIWPDPQDYPIIDNINSMYNEWGPYLTDELVEYYYEDEVLPDTGRFFFSSDRKGNQDIYYCYYSPGGATIPGNQAVSVSSLNTEFEEGYLCLHQEMPTIKEAAANQEMAADQEATANQEMAVKQEMTVKQAAASNTETCYFTSDREGTFDIYRATGEANRKIETSGALQITKMDHLSSTADDKCPYIVNNMMVFTSDREGGQGGFDLWYSLYTDGTWSAPENFGPEINSEYDEYRPVIIPIQPDIFLNDMLIFSSNRPGGKGGFDLYYTGLNKRTGTSFTMQGK